MAYSAEVMRRAYQRLESEKADADSLYRERLQTVYHQLPRVQEIDSALKKSMVLATQALFSGQEGAAEAMEQVKKANLSLQKERRELIDRSFGPNYLEAYRTCQKCGGLGYIGAHMCSCLQALCVQEQQKELDGLACGQGDFQNFRLDYYPDRPLPGSQLSIRRVMAKTLEDCRSYAENFGKHSQNLLFSGDTGLGKTFLSACIARAVTDRGSWVVYESAPHLFEKLERARFSGDEQAGRDATQYTDCDLLIVDDLGTEMGGQFVTTALYTLINDRLRLGKNTIISTNLTIDQLEKRYSAQILSRLRGSYKRVAFVGDDIRILQNTGALR